MYDQSFNHVSLAKMLRKSDFLSLPKLKNQAIKEAIINKSVACADNGMANEDFLSVTLIKNKAVHNIPDFTRELILRKIDRNLRRSISLPPASRDSIIANIKNLLSEGVQYRVYRLDIKSFYESFDVDEVTARVATVKKLSPQTKKMIADILENYRKNGGMGVPRGLSLSATLSDLMMNPVDHTLSRQSDVFYFSRYVDDIIIVTSGNECPKTFVKNITRILPKGLHLNKRKEQICLAADSKQFKSTASTSSSPSILRFEYLGYSFSVHEPFERDKFRDVHLDIAESKINKVKTRLTKALIDYCKNKDFSLLETRIRFLTTNFSVLDVNRDSYRLAGIYHNYHRIDASKSKALPLLDEYLRRAALSSHGKVFTDFYICTNPAQRRKLMTFSFQRSFEAKTYTYFSRQQFTKIQECWKYA